MKTTKLGLRSDLQMIMEQDPELATRFQNLRDELNAAPSSLRDSIPAREFSRLLDVRETGRSGKTVNKHAIWDELQVVVGKIQKLPGCGSFCDALSNEEMKLLAKKGPIVVLNTDSIRCDAFLITAERIDCIPLNKLTLSDLKEKAQRIRQIVEAGDARGFIRIGPTYRKYGDGDSMKETLQWLWESVVGPIFAALGISDFHQPPGDASDCPEDLRPAQPHVWWVTSGSLSSMPIHAAGDFRAGRATSALDMVVSSYAPTLRSLWYARMKAESQLPVRPSRTLLVKMKETYGQSNLPGAEIEVAGIDSLLPPDITRTIPLKPTRESSLSSLEECNICHMACHGQSHASNPSMSRLLLSDSDNPLTVRDISHLDLSHAQLAYLSACSAADNRVGELLDENIHLAAGFLLAGFPTVIGTLWQIRDSRSADVAQDFYRGLLVPELAEGNREVTIDVALSARSLNAAVRHLRDRLGDQPDAVAVWAPYIHLGV